MEKLVVRGTEISVQWNSSRDDFISLTDIAKLKDSDNPRYIIQNWLRNRNTIEFLGVWESLYNPEFNRVEFDAFRSQAGLNSFVMTPQKWIEATGAIGIVSKAGRYGGTYAHKEIAFEFASWISVEFKLYLVKEFERLFGTARELDERIRTLRAASAKYGLVILLKGAGTLVAVPSGKLYKNTTGNPGMATAGSGDVLAGIIGGLLAQGYSPEEAAIKGVFMHGKAGDAVLRYKKQEALIASDIIQQLNIQES